MSSTTLPNCWEIMKCDLKNINDETDVCPALLKDMGHSCWALEEIHNHCVKFGPQSNNRGCLTCQVFARYNRITGIDKEKISAQLPLEERQFDELLLSKRIKQKQVG